jgi:Rap1a immunity proteins
MMKALLIFPLVFAASVSAQAEWQRSEARVVFFDSGNNLVQECSPKPSDYCAGAVSGYSDMLQTMGETCVDANVTKGQVADVVVKFLGDHPEFRNLAAASLAHAALSKAFPCPKNKSGAAR